MCRVPYSYLVGSMLTTLQAYDTLGFWLLTEDETLALCCYPSLIHIAQCSLQ